MMSYARGKGSQNCNCVVVSKVIKCYQPEPWGQIKYNTGGNPIT